MAAAVTAMVEEHGGENAHRVRALKLAYLHERLLALDQLRGGSGFHTLFDTFSHRVAADLIAQATPFFWYAVDRTTMATGGTEQNSAFRQTAEYLFEASVDALFVWLPDGATFSFAPQGRELAFPRLRLLVTRAALVTLTRLSPRRLRLDVDGAVRSVDLDDVPNDIALPALVAPGHRASLLLVAPRSLFEEIYRAKVVPATPAASELAQTIGASLDLITRVDPTRAAALEAVIEWYIPIASQQAETHNSFSVRGLFGAIFLSEAYSDLRLAEAIVHEYHHNELYLLQESESICETVPGELFYSPWRSDPRPLDGLLHALHVFSGLAEFLARVELASKGDRIPVLRDRRLDIVRKLHLALLQVQHNRLSSAGAALVRSATAEVEQHAHDLGRVEVERLSELMVRQIDRWKRENPALAERVRTPEQERALPTPRARLER